MIWIQPRCLAIDKCIKNMWYMYIKEYYLVIKENEILPFRTTWMDLKSIMLNEIVRQRKINIGFHLYM